MDGFPAGVCATPDHRTGKAPARHSCQILIACFVFALPHGGAYLVIPGFTDLVAFQGRVFLPAICTGRHSAFCLKTGLLSCCDRRWKTECGYCENSCQQRRHGDLLKHGLSQPIVIRSGNYHLHITESSCGQMRASFLFHIPLARSGSFGEWVYPPNRRCRNPRSSLRRRCG